MYEKNIHIYEFETTSPNWLFHHSGKTSKKIPQRLWWINSVSMLTLVHRKFATARSRRNFCFGFISWKKRMMFFRECFHMMDAVWRLKYLVETYHHRIFLKDDHSPPQSKDIWDVSETIMKILIILGDMVEFLGWKFLKMKNARNADALTRHRCTCHLQKRRCSGWKRGETHYLNYP